ncbi:MAG: DUF4080 domain-containing protein [Magnetococcales bacterium]|nr:DUF4080 domain-containing protein [Magnetococcales bacterium]
MLANMGVLQPHTVPLEFDLQNDPIAMAEAILAHQPAIVGIGIYIWNVTLCHRLVRTLKRLRRELVVVLGGPQVSHETAQHPIVADTDYVITGEADVAFGQLCQAILVGQRPEQTILPAPLPDLAALDLPYHYYREEDIAHRILYVESSRGCPFHCTFCLSALDHAVRLFPLGPFLAAMQQLLERGARRFKFVDRSFNLHLARAEAILDFFLTFLRRQPTEELFLHFEMIPDRLPESLRQLLQQFPAGVVQLEIGIQSFNGEVQQQICRRQDDQLTEQNLRWLRQSTGIHLHTDLIAGLPGEDLASFAAGFDRLLVLEPHEIQIGLLKRLPGTPLGQGMIFNPDPPYELLYNQTIDFTTMQRIKRLSHYWDMIGNSGRFPHTLALLRQIGASPCATLMQLSDWLYDQTAALHGIALRRLCQLLVQGGVELFQLELTHIQQVVLRDYQRVDPGGQLPLLARQSPLAANGDTAQPRRQRRHRF